MNIRHVFVNVHLISNFCCSFEYRSTLHSGERNFKPPPVKKLKTNARGPGHRKKSAAEDLLKLDDSEVEHDSISRLFMKLMTLTLLRMTQRLVKPTL